MNVTQLKALIWLLALGVGGYLVWGAADFFRNQAALMEPVSSEEQVRVLESVEPPEKPQESLVQYPKVLSTLVQLNWTGEKAPEPAPVAAQAEAEAEAPSAVPVADILTVLFLRFDSARGTGSVALVKYLDPALVQRLPAGVQELREGDTLPEPHEHVIVESIGEDEVIFTFEDEERESERLRPTEYDEGVSLIARIEGGVVVPAAPSLIPRAPVAAPFRPAKTTALGSNRWRIGYEDSQYISDNWSEILSREVRDRRHRDPVTGRYDGIEITELASGSVAARHGVQEGDILKSINGTAVTSKSEAIKYVRNNDDVYDRWEVVIERLGKEVTMLYEEPPEE